MYTKVLPLQNLQSPTESNKSYNLSLTHKYYNAVIATDKSMRIHLPRNEAAEKYESIL